MPSTFHTAIHYFPGAPSYLGPSICYRYNGGCRSILFQGPPATTTTKGVSKADVPVKIDSVFPRATPLATPLPEYPPEPESRRNLPGAGIDQKNWQIALTYFRLFGPTLSRLFSLSTRRPCIYNGSSSSSDLLARKTYFVAMPLRFVAAILENIDVIFRARQPRSYHSTPKLWVARVN